MKIILNFFVELVILTVKLAVLIAIAGIIFTTWVQNYDVLGSMIVGMDYVYDYSNLSFFWKMAETVVLTFFLVTFYFLFFLEYKGNKKDPGLVDVWKQLLGM